VRVLNVGTTNVQVVYSKPVEALSATNPANYVLTDGVPITAGSLSSDNLSVLLKSGPLVYGSNYTLVVNNVRDRATVPNTIAPNTSVQFQATLFAFQDIGSPPVPSAVTFVSNNALNVTAVGSGIGGFVDQFNLNFQVRVGDFDVKARIA